jgi:hypothetical protein
LLIRNCRYFIRTSGLKGFNVIIFELTLLNAIFSLYIRIIDKIKNIFHLIVEVLLRKTAQKMGAREKVFRVIKEIFSDSEKYFMAQKTFPKSVENSVIKMNSEYIFVV